MHTEEEEASLGAGGSASTPDVGGEGGSSSQPGTDPPSADREDIDTVIKDVTKDAAAEAEKIAAEEATEDAFEDAAKGSAGEPGKATAEEAGKGPAGEAGKAASEEETQELEQKHEEALNAQAQVHAGKVKELEVERDELKKQALELTGERDATKGALADAQDAVLNKAGLLSMANESIKDLKLKLEGLEETLSEAKAELSKKESQIADLQENVKSQQTETSKAKEELTGSLAAIEKLKENFKNERAGWDTEKAALLKRAEGAEAALNPVTEELTGLKRQIDAMTSAVFGSRIAHLRSDMRNKLKAAYTLIEQLYTGAQRIICTASHNKPPPT
nr:translation initiation factor IF-2-like [Aegilops tauschii subsp. strangulata]